MDDGGLVDGRGSCVVNRGSVVDGGSVVHRGMVDGVVHRGVVDNGSVVDDGGMVDDRGMVDNRGRGLVGRGLDCRGNVLRVLCLAII